MTHYFDWIEQEAEIARRDEARELRLHCESRGENTMRSIAQYQFPTTPEERAEWKRVTQYYAAHRQVLYVATTRIEGTWKAYVAPVPGKNHDEEWEAVLRRGVPVWEPEARIYFPEFAALPYAN
jgi:hypothetical protein